MMNREFDILLSEYLDEISSPERVRRLVALLKENPGLRKRFREAVRMHVLMHEVANVMASGEAVVEPGNAPGVVTTSRRIRTAAKSRKVKVDPVINEFRMNWLGLAAAACVVIALGLNFLLIQRKHADMPVAIAHLYDCRGVVTIQRGTVMMKVQTNVTLLAGDCLSVDSKGLVWIDYPDSTRLEVRSLTKMILEPQRIRNEQKSKAGKLVFVESGKLIATVAKQPEGRPMIFKTPQAEVTVLGTKLTVNVNAQAANTRVDVATGLVRLARISDGSAVQIAAKETTVCAEDTPLKVHRTPSDSTHNDVTSAVELLGNPFAARYPKGNAVYARNVWCMQVFDDRLYLGHGDSSANSGPIDIWCWTVKSNAFVKEYTVNEEQIDRYRIINGKLFIPGHDPREGWEFGNFYCRDINGWTKKRTIPNGINTYDLYGYHNKLFAALNSRSNVVESLDGGQTWTGFEVRCDRVYSLFELGNVLLATSSRDVWRYNGHGFEMTKDFCPGGNELVTRPRNYQDKLIYIGATNVNNHQWTPHCLYIANA